MKKKTWTSVLLWVLAFFLTALTVVYQRMTGPTYPVRGKEILNETEISYFLLRSYTTDKGDMPVRITAPDKNITAFLNYKRFKTEDDWKEVDMNRTGDTLAAEIPGQPAAGKIEYSIYFK